ncbi:MAG: hypothetical protein FWF03_04830 [Defluviitaleaceae bacterium]|nr:hypothetical protein [Defluviitaleaceae bacterium]
MQGRKYRDYRPVKYNRKDFAYHMRSLLLFLAALAIVALTGFLLFRFMS